MDDRLRTRFSSQVRQAAPVLFTGAGFSAGARTPAADSLPDARTLTEGLWEVVFPGEPFEESTLGKVYEAGLRTAGKRTTDFVRKSLTVDPRSLPEWYRAWFAFPWHRIYTVNIDDLADAADRAFDLPREIKPISALTDTVPTVGDMHLQVVHLNGQIADLPDVTFSPRQYGERLSRPDPWYAALARDLKLHPVVFVGTALDEPPLWMYIEARGAKPPGRETRPGSYLLTPKLDRASLVTLGGLNVDWVSGTAESFSGDVLIGMEGEADEGLKRIRRRTRQEESGPIWLDVAAVSDDSKDDEREFLMGREPRWSDVSGGYAFARSFDEALAQEVQDDDPRLVVISGTAGVGKSTSAMRFVLNAVAEGASAAMLNPTNYARHREIRNAASATKASSLFIDDVARFGGGARDLVEDLLIDNPDSRLVICARSGRMEALGSLVPDGVPVVEASVPSLEPSDIELLLDALDNANRLGGS